MKSNIKYIQTRTRLNLASEHLTVAYWSGEKYHADKAREAFLMALAGCHEASRENLVDLIASAIDDTIDVDWTSEQAAGRIVEVLLDDVIPPIEGADQ